MIGRRCYLVAVTTGLRRSELEQLQWGDVHLYALKPFIRVRSTTTKNRKSAVLWLRREVVDELRRVRPADADDASWVFAGGVPDMATFRADLAAAGIAEHDDAGSRKVVFHSLRHTLATNLSRVGVSPRVAMEVMRHSDLRLTMRTYTDAAMLDTSDAVERLPGFDDAPSTSAMTAAATGTDGGPSLPLSHESSQSGVRSGPSLSVSVQAGEGGGVENRPQKQGESQRLSASDTSSQVKGKSWGTRIRT